MKKFLLPLAKYGSSRLVFRFFGSLEYSRLRLSFCPPAHSEPPQARPGADSVRAIFLMNPPMGFLDFLNFSLLPFFFPPPPMPAAQKAGGGANSVRAIFRIHRQLEFFKLEEAASLRSAANSYSFLCENEKDLSIRAKEIFSNL